MEKVQRIKSRVIPLPIKDVDTDMIIPAQYLTSISASGYGANLFRRLRDQDPAFPFNKPEYARASILVADDNFGCGSSREHAVWALLDAGIRAVICKSFADIFFNNSLKNGLLPIKLPHAAVDNILARSLTENYVLCVDLEAQEVACPDRPALKFDFDPFRKHCLLNGLDDVQYIQSYAAQLAEYRRESALPWNP
ncbi:MAG TPA: 3-isopropylmalate dehydratase small subunit [Candidatus Obscuribacterales bacterium]